MVVKRTETGKVEEKYPRAKVVDTSVPLKHIIMVAESASNVRVVCPFCQKDSYIKMGRGLDQKNPNKLITFSRIVCQNRMCKKSIDLKDEKTQVVATHHFNSVTWEVTDSYITEDGKMVAITELDSVPRIDNISIAESEVIEAIVKMKEEGPEHGI